MQPDDSAYWVEMVKCRHACPVHTDACGYVNAIAEGRVRRRVPHRPGDESVRVNLRARLRRAVRGELPARGAGRACVDPCVKAIRDRASSGRRPATTRGIVNSRDETMLPPNRGDYERVAVVGGGVSGMTVAHDLTRIGYKVTVFEADDEPGGMTRRRRAGFPAAARPGAARDSGHPVAGRGAEVQYAAGPRLHDPESAATRATRPSSSASGCRRGESCHCRARSWTGSTTAWSFCGPSTRARRCRWASAIVVIGGGNVAYDVARVGIAAGVA